MFRSDLASTRHDCFCRFLVRATSKNLVGLNSLHLLAHLCALTQCSMTCLMKTRHNLFTRSQRRRIAGSLDFSMFFPLQFRLKTVSYLHRSKIYAETSQSDTENTAGSGTQFPTVTLSSSHIGPWDTTDFSVRLEPVTHLEQSLKFPTYIWSDDFKLVLTCPIYSDSVFLTSPTLFAEDFVRAGLEARGILKDDYLPVTGD